MGEGGRELIAADEPTLVTKPSLDATVVEDGQSGTRLTGSRAGTDESDRSEVFHQTDDLLDRLAAAEALGGGGDSPAMQ